METDRNTHQPAISFRRFLQTERSRGVLTTKQDAVTVASEGPGIQG